MTTTDTTNMVLAFIEDYFQADNWPPAPSYREIMAGVDEINSLSGVNYHVGKLERQGRVTREPGIPRSIQLVKPKTIKSRDYIITCEYDDL